MRERFLLENKVSAPQEVMKSGKRSWTYKTTVSQLQACREDIE